MKSKTKIIDTFMNAHTLENSMNFIPTIQITLGQVKEEAKTNSKLIQLLNTRLKMISQGWQDWRILFVKNTLSGEVIIWVD